MVDQQIDSAVVVNVGRCQAARRAWNSKHLIVSSNFRKPPGPFIVMKQETLLEPAPTAESVGLRINVPIRDNHVVPAIVVGVKELHTPTEEQPRRWTDIRRPTRIVEHTLP